MLFSSEARATRAFPRGGGTHCPSLGLAQVHLPVDIVVHRGLIVNNGLVRKKLLNGERNLAVPPAPSRPAHAALHLAEETLRLAEPALVARG